MKIDFYVWGQIDDLELKASIPTQSEELRIMLEVEYTMFVVILKMSVKMCN